MKLSAHFTLEELTASDTAKKLGISNEPPKAYVDNLSALCNNLLEPLRVAWGYPIFVTSGYRGPLLNNYVKGSATSAHCFGLAADIVPANGEIKKFKAFVLEYLKETHIAYDQYIDERNTKGSEWVHIGLRNARGQQRRQNLITTDAKHYSVIK